MWQSGQAAVAFLATTVAAQIGSFEVQPNTWNSSWTLSAQQIQDAQLTDQLANNVEIVTNSDRSQLAYGGPSEDDFYTLPPLTNTTGPLQPGVVLKTQRVTDPFGFSIPPNTALSRFMYTTTTLNGTVVPATAFVLWPFEPRQFEQTSSSSDVAAPVVLWAHGTSGFNADGAPSAMRNLWYAFAAPFALAQDGYAVIGPDYAGLGIDKSWDGSHIAHQYGIAQVGARDALYGLQAAWGAFPGKLTKDFVAMGHSQGGGVAWAVAEQLALRTDEFDSGKFGGYRGTIAGSPVVDLFGSAPSLLSNVVGVGVSSIFHDFTLDLWLTPLGLARNKLWTSIKGGIGASQQLFLNGDVTKDNYTDQSWHAAAFEKLANPGRKDFRGPLLVLEGTEDAYVSYEGVKSTVEDTCAMFPDNDLELLVVNGTGHTPTLDATRPRWLRWIQDRFENKPVRTAGCRTSHMTSWLPIEQYLAVGGYFTQWVADAKYNYQAVLGL